MAKVEWHPGELYPGAGFIVTNLARSADGIVAFRNRRGTCEQYIEEGKRSVLGAGPLRLNVVAFTLNAARGQDATLDAC